MMGKDHSLITDRELNYLSIDRELKPLKNQNFLRQRNQ